jgi:hypothetical protein
MSAEALIKLSVTEISDLSIDIFPFRMSFWRYLLYSTEFLFDDEKIYVGVGIFDMKMLFRLMHSLFCSCSCSCSSMSTFTKRRPQSLGFALDCC